MLRLLPVLFLMVVHCGIVSAQPPVADTGSDPRLQRTRTTGKGSGDPVKHTKVKPIKYERGTTEAARRWRITDDSTGIPTFHRGDEPFERFINYKLTDNPANKAWQLYPGIPGANGPIYAIGVVRDQIFFGGDFTEIGGIKAKNIAKWNAVTHKWSPLERGTNGPVFSMAITNDSVFIGGAFTRAGDWAANYVAWYDASAERWTELGDGVSHWVYSVAVDERGRVFAGGLFLRAGEDTTARHVAMWDGKKWHGIGGGLNSWVFAIAARNNHVYVGGAFDEAGTIPAPHVAEYHLDSETWEQMGYGIDDIVYTLTIDSIGDVYAGGQFSSADSTYANNLARWNCSNRTWTGFPVGVLYNPCPVFISSISFRDGIMYVGGRFYRTDSTQAYGTYFAGFNGRNWITYGDGVSDDVYAVQPTEYGVFVGGRFGMAGSKPAYGVACVEVR